MIPLVDLKAQYAAIKPEIDAAVQSVLDEAVFYKGRWVEVFEEEFAAYIGSRYAVGVANCTDALFLSLKALRIGPGDEVIVPAMTFIATAEAVTTAGARPIFVDIDPETCNMDLDAVRRGITTQTRAIVPVHLYGRAVDMGRLISIADTYGIPIVEDCAQAAGAAWRCCRVGSWGMAGCFSFYPSKNLGGYGDGGAVVTNDEYVATRIRALADHGRLEKYDHFIEGVSSRLDALQAAVLSVKLGHLDEWNLARRQAALAYQERLRDVAGVELPATPDNPNGHVFHLYVVRVKDRDEVKARMAEQGVETGVHYPEALPFTKAYARYGHRPEDFPNAHALSQECLALPMYPELTAEQIDHVSNSLKEAVRD